ncbi:MAG: 50S ribosomal protein L25 [Verrucomicrobiales bacterium]|nr:50S ribosomal protein L25 [Verrucomicrobiales bacterium]MDP4938176.1 50S ribosomal protein L25 [Verrucomicrobiales bacterium]
MAKQETLQAEKRDVKGTTASKRLRRTGVVPAVIYGSNQREYTIQLDSKSFFDLARKQASHNFLVNIEIAGANEKTKLAIVQDIQRDPLNGSLIHVDFRAVSESDTIHAAVPIELRGEPVGVKTGGLLEQLVHEIEVSCSPSNLPDAIVNDVESLKIGQSLKVSQLNLPEGVTVKLDGEVLVALITQTRASISEGTGGAEEVVEEAPAAEGEAEASEEA